MNLLKSLILFLISVILVACVVFLFIKIPVFTTEQQAIAIFWIALIGIGAVTSLVWSVVYLISNDFD